MDENISDPTNNSRTIIALFHGVSWNASTKWAEIGDGVTLANFRGSTPQDVYHELCHTRHIDGGDPFGFEVYATLQSGHTELPFGYGDPYSVVDWLSNLITICTGIPVGMCRVISPWLNHEQPVDTELVYCSRGQTEFLESGYARLNDESLRDISRIWSRSNQLWPHGRKFGRLVSSLTFFHYSWRSHYIEQICLNLAIALEILFSPHDRTEMSHQIAFNVAKFVESTPDKREELYRKIKKFYGHRSSIVHGGVPSDDKIIDLTVEIFRLVASILKRILLDDTLAETFNIDKLRKVYFGQRLFTD